MLEIEKTIIEKLEICLILYLKFIIFKIAIIFKLDIHLINFFVSSALSGFISI